MAELAVFARSGILAYRLQGWVLCLLSWRLRGQHCILRRWLQLGILLSPKAAGIA
jgi:hypothetical protein